MSFASGNTTDSVALIKLWRDFLITAGWTVDANAAQGTGWLVAVSKGTKHVAMRAFINEGGAQLGGSATGSGIALTGYSGTYVVPGVPANWWNQAGAPYLYNQSPTVNVITTVMVLPAATIPNYWMFANAAGDNVILVAQRGTGIYNYLYFGDIVKAQAWNGGFYFGASSPMYSPFDTTTTGNTIMGPPPGGMMAVYSPSFITADVDSWTGKWLSLTADRAPTTIFATGKSMMSSTSLLGASDAVAGQYIHYGSLRQHAASARTGGLVMLPTHWLAERDFGGTLFGGGWSLMGTIPDIFQCTTDGFVPGATFTISTDSYLVFPTFAVRKYP